MSSNPVPVTTQAGSYGLRPIDVNPSRPHIPQVNVKKPDLLAELPIFLKKRLHYFREIGYCQYIF